MAKDLNKLLHYNKIKPVKYSLANIERLKSNPIKSENDWSLRKFYSIKKYLKEEHYIIQKRKCAYCRGVLNVSGGNEHLDHLVALSIKKEWMFKPRNLVLSCYLCNIKKSASYILAPGVGLKRLPKKAANYILFNPYVHVWSDHFEIEDGIFLRSKSVEGSNTISKLKMYDHKYAIAYAEMSDTLNKSVLQKATNRLITFQKGSFEYESAKKLIKLVERLLD